MPSIVIGKVKWFSETKGFGFIEQDSGPDVFAHISDFVDQSLTTLDEGQMVEFVIVDGRKGPQATKIALI